MYFSGCSWVAWSRDNCYPKDHFQGNLTAERGATSADEIVSSTSWRPFPKLSYSTWTDACGTRRCMNSGVVGRHSRHIIEPANYIFSFYFLYYVIRVTFIGRRWLHCCVIYSAIPADSIYFLKSYFLKQKMAFFFPCLGGWSLYQGI